ncbi:glucose-1-phosphate thymidylyltransferase [Candidatus Uhrbacteria bacterium RIFCSPLOWO2_01_FULL_47_24]|uniref:Glucose-1-phosphate thymidylyltransferase n=1 Tax=Candidatus Uhrbacteria bacterium RIFCSPLOWO2_01_FULL_47_24 TaxID=1802401 RepID=A0A1F7URL2_9BACT|nr:MAG: glucose-1-phosphate thymidylyltransferase [Candidatus Uhrbacteria bacterium RIFCSPHIGHO2_01_FULL_47_11]OGL67576.1 MAG: glucose-1-phosphate thymidylyltransferase [Candidatus Uhrbacteria bacterium RIFCSPHIGHO2_02_FULL_46_47]OGL75072.1 MAG: glucose-1-phosphate thymidylyltransferase [Candidatus Uhrbacteria bacterium RIFCSPHIGHO2_12_FULL_47_11]OGL80930.1 MAG: glucose-1-phosphate thymidylyltransferase [Candidatus Uhrbacteria bacterium RIFCSPLOWO2_01_FULL_47_24]OGL84265.1 MAG: glucose-1-phosph
MRKALLAAGGRATRLRPITHTLNKHLIPLANKPMLFYGIETLVKAGIKEIFVNVNPGEMELQKVLGDGSRWSVSIKCIEQQGGPLGLAHIVKNAQSYIGNEPFIFYLGDNVILDSIGHMVEKFQRDNLDMCLAFAHIANPKQFGVAEIVNGKLVRIIEKPENPPSDLAQTGIYLYSPKIFEAVKAIQPSPRGEYEISDANTWMIEKGYNVGWVEVPGWWKDTGKPEDLLEGNQFIMSHFRFEDNKNGAKIGERVQIQGRIQIGEGTQLDENVLVRGPVIIGKNCVIKNSYIGPYTSIGNEVEIYNTEIENSIVFDAVDINAGTRIVDSIIGYNAAVNSAHATLPLGHKLIIGDNTVVEI